MPTTQFPIDLTRLRPLELDPAAAALTEDERVTLRHNIQLFRDAIVFVTALAGAKVLAANGSRWDTRDWIPRASSKPSRSLRGLNVARTQLPDVRTRSWF
jgi:hypothetical protein